jgi:hypothetical protein
MSPDERTQPADPFTQFWNDLMSRMGMGAQPARPSANDAMKQMQRVFLDALAKYCDDFMRSPAFLDMVKRQMESALSFQQQVNQFLTQAQRSGQPAAQTEAADLVELARGFRNRIERLEQKVEALSASSRTPRVYPPSRASGGPRAAKRPAKKTLPSQKRPRPRRRNK